MQKFMSILIFNKVRLTFLYSLLPPCFAWDENQENMQSSSFLHGTFSLTKTKDQYKTKKTYSHFQGRSTRKYTANQLPKFHFLVYVLSRVSTTNSKFAFCLQSKQKYLFKYNSQIKSQEQSAKENNSCISGILQNTLSLIKLSTFLAGSCQLSRILFLFSGIAYFHQGKQTTVHGSGRIIFMDLHVTNTGSLR